MPWWLKICAKIVLARLPMKYGLWRTLKLFRHGAMVDPDYALKVFRRHHQAVQDYRPLQPGFTALELGPGDSVLSALLVKAFGGQYCTLVDSGDFADKSPETYRQAVSEYQKLGHLNLPPLEDIVSREKVLELTNSTYLCHGVLSLQTLPEQSVDFIWSQAVLEHVLLNEVRENLTQMRRIIRDDGICSHRVDLKDHLTSGLNNLRFSRALWEGELFSKSGFYTNRIRFSEYLKLFEEAGFTVQVTAIEKWDKLPISRHALNTEWRDLPEEELLVSGFDVLLTPI